MCPLGTLAITFKIYSLHTQWVCDGHIDSVPTMNSPCTHQVNDPLPPVLVPDDGVKEPTEPPNRLFEASSSLGIKFPNCIRNRYVEDKFYERILANPEEFTNFEVKDGLIYFRSEGTMVVAVPDVQERGQRIQEVLISQAHSILAHLGSEKTVTYLRDQV